jgi:uncharacterized RDD family membrane protein YckC
MITCNRCGSTYHDETEFCPRCNKNIERDYGNADNQKTNDSQKINYAKPLERIGAYFIDGLVIVAARVILTLIYFILGFILDIKESPLSLAVGTLFFIAVFLYFPAMESSRYQGTIGKIYMKMIVADLHGNRISFLKAFYRNFFKFLLFFGFIAVFISKRNMALHDIIAGTIIIDKKIKIIVEGEKEDIFCVNCYKVVPVSKITMCCPLCGKDMSSAFSDQQTSKTLELKSDTIIKSG